MEDAPTCWGQYRATCECQWHEACKLCTETEPDMTRPLGGMDYDALGSWAPDVADNEHIPGADNETEEDTTTHSMADFKNFLNFILNLDDYSLGVICSILAPGDESKKYNVSDLARIHHVSRQAMHRKTLDMARKNPELCSLLGLTVRKIRNTKREFLTPFKRTRTPADQEDLFDVSLYG